MLEGREEAVDMTSQLNLGYPKMGMFVLMLNERSPSMFLLQRNDMLGLSITLAAHPTNTNAIASHMPQRWSWLLRVFIGLYDIGFGRDVGRVEQRLRLRGHARPRHKRNSKFKNPRELDCCSLLDSTDNVERSLFYSSET